MGSSSFFQTFILFVLFALNVSIVVANPGFGDLMPNGYNIPCASGMIGCYTNGTCIALGHNFPNGSQWCGNTAGADAIIGQNSFGQSFATVDWKISCKNDSDLDGVSSGAEVGDPACIWSVFNPIVRTSKGLTHPGDATQLDPSLLQLNCFKWNDTITGKAPAPVSGFNVRANPTSVVCNWALYTEACAYVWYLKWDWSENVTDANNVTTTLAKTDSAAVQLSSYGTHSYTITGLPLKTSVSIAIVAGNDFGNSTQAPPTIAVTTDASVPKTPGSFSVSASGLSATATWTPPVDNGGLNITNYYLYLLNNTQSLTVSVFGNESSFIFGNLAVARTYHLRMFAENAAGNGSVTSYVTFSTALTSSACIAFVPTLLLAFIAFLLQLF